MLCDNGPFCVVDFKGLSVFFDDALPHGPSGLSYVLSTADSWTSVDWTSTVTVGYPLLDIGKCSSEGVCVCIQVEIFFQSHRSVPWP